MTGRMNIYDDDDESDSLREDVPTALKKYLPVIEALEEGNTMLIINAILKLFFVKIMVCLAVIVVCFFAKWWLGLVALSSIVVYAAMKAFSLFKKFEEVI